MMHKSRAVVFLWEMLVLLLAAAAGVLVFIFTRSYEVTRALADRLSKDGSLELFSTSFFSTARSPALGIAGFLLLIALLMLLFRTRSTLLLLAVLHLPGRAFARLRADSPIFLTDLRQTMPGRRELLWVLGLLILAIAARAVFLMRPFGHDEAYTVSVFAASPLRESLSDYYLPNNHLFHTLLVHITYQFFGYQPWAVRLPAFLTGVLAVPAVYILARRLYGHWTALVAGALTAFLPALIDFSTNARGYPLVILFAILVLCLAIYVCKRANLLAWLLIVIFSTLAFYTIPVFAFAFATFCVWLGLMWLIGDVDLHAYGSRWGLIRWLVIAIAATVVLTLLLYTPVFLRFGVRAVFPKEVLEPIRFPEYLRNMWGRLIEAGQVLTDGLPWVASILMAAGVGLSLALPFLPNPPLRSARISVLLQIAAMLGTLGLIILLRATPWARFLTFLFPLVLMWAAAGWLGCFHWLQNHFHLRWNLEGAMAILIVLVGLSGAAVRTASHPEAGFGKPGGSEQVVIFLKSQIQDQDLIVVTSPHDAPVWYYSRLHQINMDHYKRELPFFRAFFLVDSAFGQTLASVMDERMPDKFFFNNLSTAQVVYQAGGIQVIEMIPDPALIRSAYGVK